MQTPQKPQDPTLHGLPLTARTEDGYPIAVRRFGPNTAEAVVVIHPATGVLQRYYAPFARYLADNNVAVYTYDYRGIGHSRPKGSLRGFRADLIDWAARDAEAVTQLALATPGLRQLVAVGHSLGGQLLALQPSVGRYHALVSVASQSGYWRLSPKGQKTKRWWTWNLLFPVLTSLWGYFPGRRLGAMQDLPAGVARMWTAWCRHPQYHYSHPTVQAARQRFHALRFPQLVYSFADDTYASREGVGWLQQHNYPNTQATWHHVAPQDVAERHIGHFGFFQAVGQRHFWADVLAFVRQPHAVMA